MVANITKQPRAPIGGTRIGGRFYKGGRTLPNKYRKTLTESSRPRDPASGSEEVAPNFGRATLPHLITFSGMQTTLSRSYRHADEAMRDSITNAHMMLNDPMITEPLFGRLNMTALANWHIEIDDEDNAVHREIRDDMVWLLKQTPRFLSYRWALLLGVWYGRYGVENQFQRIRNEKGENRYVVNKWTPVSGDKLVFRYDDGRYNYDPDQLGIRVSPALAPTDYLAGERRLEPTADGLAYFLEDWERKFWVIHSHIHMDGEFEDPLSGGKIKGVGLRSFVYWLWYQKQEALAQLSEIVERTAQGFTVYWYPSGNDKARDEVEEIAKQQAHTNIILMPRDPELEQYGIEHQPVNTQGIEALQTLIKEQFQNLIKRLIIGQTLSSEADATGLGSGLSDLQESTMLMIGKFDATNLEESITTDLVVPLRDYNHPKFRNVAFRFKIDTESSEPEKDLEAARTLWDMGAKLNATELMDKLGLSQPGPGDDGLQNPSIMQQVQLAEQHMAGGGEGSDALSALMGGDGASTGDVPPEQIPGGEPPVPGEDQPEPFAGDSSDRQFGPSMYAKEKLPIGTQPDPVLRKKLTRLTKADVPKLLALMPSAANWIREGRPDLAEAVDEYENSVSYLRVNQPDVAAEKPDDKPLTAEQYAKQLSLFGDEPKMVGETKTENGVTYVLNQNHRWERTGGKEASKKNDVDSMVEAVLSGKISRTKANKEMKESGGYKEFTDAMRSVREKQRGRSEFQGASEEDRAKAQLLQGEVNSKLKALSQSEKDALAPHIEAVFRNGVPLGVTADEIIEQVQVDFDEAEEERDQEEARQQAEEAEFQEWKKFDDAFEVVHRSLLRTFMDMGLDVVPYKSQSGHSRYLTVSPKDGSDEMEIRISDHEQVEGGGFNPETQERSGESTIDLVMESPKDKLDLAGVVAEVRKRMGVSPLQTANQSKYAYHYFQPGDYRVQHIMDELRVVEGTSL